MFCTKVNCYCCLPLRITSRIWGWIANREVPVSLRPGIYQFYAKIFNADLEEVAGDLSGFPTLVDFFVRPLKEETRPIARNTNMVIIYNFIIILLLEPSYVYIF